VAVALVYLYCAPLTRGADQASAAPPPRELPRLALTQALVERQALSLDATAPPLVDTAQVAGRRYLAQAPGISFLAAPIYGTLKVIYKGQRPPLPVALFWLRLLLGTIPTLGMLWLLGRHVVHRVGEASLGVTAVVAYGCGTLALPGALTFGSEQLAAALVGSAWLLLADEDTREEELGVKANPMRVTIAGFLAGLAVFVDYEASLAAVALALFAFVRLRPQARCLGAWLMGGALPTVALLVYHGMCFGSPWRPAAEITAFAPFRTALQTGLHEGTSGLLRPAREYCGQLLWRLVGPGHGLLVLSPVLVLVPIGLLRLVHRTARRAEGLTSSAVLFAYLVLLSWPRGTVREGEIGPSEVACLLPFLVLPLASALQWAEQRALTRALAVAFVLVGVLVHTLTVATTLQFPAGLRNPFYDLVLQRLIDRQIPANVGTRLGLQGWVSLIPYLALIFGVSIALAADAPWQERRGRVAAAACVLAIAILGAYRAF
jgi:hypothetical protein